MSRIGKNPIVIPEGVEVNIDSNTVIVKGKLGTLTQEVKEVSVNIDENKVILTRSSDNKNHRALHGLYRSLIANMVEGVSKGFTKELELVGVGYRASHQGQNLDMSLGFSPMVY